MKASTCNKAREFPVLFVFNQKEGINKSSSEKGVDNEEIDICMYVGWLVGITYPRKRDSLQMQQPYSLIGRSYTMPAFGYMPRFSSPYNKTQRESGDNDLV